MAFSLNKTTTQYSVNSPSRYSSSSTFQCTELGCYSVDKDGTIHNNDRRELRTLKTNYKQLLGSDLSVGFTRSEGDYFFKNIKRPFDALLYWTMQNKDKLLKDETGGNKRLVDDDDLTFRVNLFIYKCCTGWVRVLSVTDFFIPVQIRTLLVSQVFLPCNCKVIAPFCCTQPRFAEFTDFSC